MPCFYDSGVGSKDLQQFRIWCKVNKLTGLIFNDIKDIPPDVIEVDYEGIDAERFGEIMPEFYSYLEYEMSSVENTDVVPQAIYYKDVINGIKYLVEMDKFEDEPFIKDFPGPGFGWLKTNKYERQSVRLYGGQTTRDYIEDMYKGFYSDNVMYPELMLNKRAKNFNITYTVGMQVVGQVPAKRKQVITVNYPHEADIPTYDVEAKQFFKDDPMVDMYNYPRLCLESEYKSVAKFCPCAKPSSGIGTCDIKNIIFAFQYCMHDWPFESTKVMGLDEIARLRNWNTSPGYPYVRYGLTQGRDAYDKYYGLIKHTIEWSQYDWMPTLFNVFLKDEVLKSEKVENNDVRTIIAPSLCGQLIAQICTLDLSSQVSTHYKTSHTQIGRTRFRGDVHMTGKRCSKFSNIEEYDIRKWDRSIKAVLMKMFWFYCWIVNESNDMKTFFQLSNVFESSIYSHMVHQSGEVIRKKYGVPSGFTLTSYANSWIHTFLNALMFCELCPRLPNDYKGKMELLKANMDFVCYGDDGLMTYSDEIKEWFSPMARSNWLRRVFDMDLPMENVKVSTGFFMSVNTFGDVDGIKFLGDILFNMGGYIVPVFQMTKVINSIIYVGRKQYSPAERVLIAFGHYVECFFHPGATKLYEWLLFLLNKYKSVEANAATKKCEVVHYLGLTNNEMIKVIKGLIMDKQSLDSFVFNRFYKDATVCTET
nr:MAG: RNA-dependent RNA polymerase [Jingmen bat astrovirus 1]